jgi:hypothetical protein
MKIRCPSCNSEIPASNIDLPGKIAKCSQCNNIFGCAEQIPAYSAATEERMPIGRPKGFTLERSTDGIIIARGWFTPAVIFLTFFCLFWNGILFVWFYAAFASKMYAIALFGSLHAAVGLGLFYTVLACYLNKTYIRISYNSLQITHKPLPWFGQRDIPRAELKQLYSRESTRYADSRYPSSYSVQVITKKGQNIELVSGLSSGEEAIFIEQEIEKYLKIEDEPVRGEIPR